jgi:hypothetical protein
VHDAILGGVAVSETNSPLDLESGPSKAAADAARLPETVAAEPYNPDRARDKTRQNIAYALIAILAGTIVMTMVLTWWLISPADPAGNAERLVRVVNIIFGPIVTLVGSATGFYFGAQTASRPPNPGP